MLVTLQLLTQFSCSLAALLNEHQLIKMAGGPLKPGFGLSGDVHMSQTQSGERN